MPVPPLLSWSTTQTFDGGADLSAPLLRPGEFHRFQAVNQFDTVHQRKIECVGYEPGANPLNLVRATINALTPFFFGGLFIKRCKRGNTKAAVFPVPVWALAITSRPSMMGGIASAWTGVGRS